MPIEPEPADEAAKNNSPKLVVVTEEIQEEKIVEKPTQGDKTEEEPAKEKRAIWPVFALFLLIGLITGSILLWEKTSTTIPHKVVLPTASPVVSISPTPQASSSAELNKETLRIQILNASGVSGAAAKAKSFLENKGYKDIKTANADSYDLDQTEISIKETKKEYLKILTEDLAEKYNPSENSPSLDKGNEFDVIIKLGKE